ncbi:matrix-remodeling-associated protein 5-like [Anguilla rostrata]|uniref:matrix-remodeling-associated protein 5-like n=1 Tax=Anguilla rostrata TaxID=7938 RepID=UPI0030CCF6E2
MAVIGTSHLRAVALLPLLLALPLMTRACPRSCSCSAPREVLCTFSHLTSVPPSIPRDTKHLNLGFNHIQTLNGSEFTGLRSLGMLMLHGNDIQSLPLRAFYNLRSLWILKLSHNKLRNITRGIFEGLSSLVRLHLDHNSIEFIEPFSFSGLTSLALLNLEGNQLRDLHSRTFVTLSFLGSFWGSSLRYLYLSDNQLGYLLPGTLQNLNKLEALTVHGNPWACDCNLQWLLLWNTKNKGVIKCRKEGEIGTSVNCAMCSSPQSLNNNQVFQLATSQLSCDRPTLNSPLKLRESNVWLDTDSDIPYIKDLEPPLGHLTLMLSDSHTNMAYVDCVVKHQAEGSTMSWQNLKSPSQVALNVTLMSFLECEINRDDLQQLWRLVAYYYERPAILKQGLRQENASRTTFQYSQVVSEDSPYFTDLKGYLSAEPTWLLQPLVTLQLNRRKTTSKTLVLNFSTFISKQISIWDRQRVTKYNWAFVHRGAPGKVHTVLEGSDVSLDCKVSSFGQASVEWMLPDLSTLTTSHARIVISEEDKLVIHKVSPSDSGLYHCLVRSEADVDIVSFRVFVRERVLSPDHINGKEISLDSGESVTLPCSMSSVEPSDMAWYLPTNTILWPSSPEGRIKMLSNGSLVIINATYKDDGIYSCLAVNLYGVDMLSHRVVIRGKINPEEVSAGGTSRKPKKGGTSETGKRIVDEGSGCPETECSHVLDGHDSSWVPLYQNSDEKVIDSARKINSFSHWTQNRARFRSKAPVVLQTPQHITATYTHTTATFTTAADRTTTTTIPAKSSMPYMIETPKHQATTIYQGSGESDVFKMSLASPASVTVGYMGKSHATPRRRPHYRRRRPLQRRIQPGRFSQKSSVPPHNRIKSAQDANSLISTGTQENKPSASWDSVKSQVLETNIIYTDNAELPGGSNIIDSASKQYIVTSEANLWPVTGKPIHIHINPTSHTEKYMDKTYNSNTRSRPYTNAFQGSAKHQLSTEITGLIKNRLHIAEGREQHDKQLLRPFGNADRKSTADYMPRFNHSRVMGRPVPIATESSSVTTTVSLLVNVTPPPAVTFPNQTSEYSSSTEKETISKDSSTSSSGDFFYLVREKLRANKSNEDSLKSVLESSVSSEVKAGHPWVLQRHIQGKVTVPPTDWPHPKHVPRWSSFESSQEHTSFPKRSWNNLSPEGQDAGVTVPQGITVLPSNISLLSARSVSPKGRTPIPPTFQPPNTGALSKIKDFAWFSRLRNRYRQHKLDVYRLSQARKIITTEPNMKFLNPQPQPAPTALYNSAVTQAYSLLATNQTHSAIQYDSQRHYSHQGQQKLNNIPPSPRLMESGMKPKISSLNTDSLSAFIETDVSLPCEWSGVPRPTLSWTRGASIEASTKNGERFKVLSNGTLVIKNVQLQDKGQYICTAKNAFGSDQQVITLLVITQPPKIVPPKSTDMLVHLGHPINLDCVAEGKPQAQISWILPNGKTIWGRGLLDDTVSVLTNGTLRIEAANLSSKGQYKCIASSTAGADTLTYHIHAVASSPTINEEATEDIVLRTGTNAYIHCTAKGEPKPTIEWIIPDEEKSKAFPFIRGRVSVFSNGTLLVRNISLTDSGTYQCSATNQAGVTKRVVKLEVKQDKASTEEPLPQQQGITAIYGSTLYLHCSGFTTSQHGAVWKLPSGMFLDYSNSSGGPITAFPNSTLKIQQLTEKDAGSYLCLFRTSRDQDFKLFQVEVLMMPPKIKRLAAVHKRVAYGDSFQIDCLASGFPAPEVSWSLPEGTVVDSTLQHEDKWVMSPRFMVFGNGTLLLMQIGKGDEGDYTCKARNRFGQDVMKVRIHLLPDSPRILSKDEVSIWGVLGEPVHIRCQAIGEPTPTITWFSPSNATITTSSIRYQILGDGTLIIRKVGLADRGNYACVAKSLSGYDVKKVHLEVKGGAPRINRQVGRAAVKVSAVFNQTLLLDCKAEGLPEPRVTWTTSYGINLPTPYLGGRFQVYGNGSLELHTLRKTDEGLYVCLAQNSLGAARLEVDLQVKSLTEKPSFSKANTEVMSFKPGSAEVTLGCYASGKPTPEIVWVLPNSTMLTAGARLQRFHHIPGGGLLRILQPGNGDMGVYRCLANNTAGRAEKRFALEPGWKPQIQGKPMAVRLSFGQNLNLPCSVDAWPQAAISWTLPNSRVLRIPQAIGRLAYLRNGTLELSEAAIVDRGTYTCKATNAFGSSALSHTVTVTVHPPRITNAFPSVIVVNRGATARLSCRAVGIPKPDISWTLPGSTSLTPTGPVTTQNGMHVTADGSLVIQNPMLTNSGIYKCNARSAVGMDFKATYLQVL